MYNSLDNEGNKASNAIGSLWERGIHRDCQKGINPTAFCIVSGESSCGW